MTRFGYFNRIFPLILLLFLDTVVKSLAIGDKGLYFDYVEDTSRVLLLRCQVRIPVGVGQVISIAIYNETSHTKQMAWVQNDVQPMLGKQHATNHKVFLSGCASRISSSTSSSESSHSSKSTSTRNKTSSKDNIRCPALRLIFLEFESFNDQTFRCKATILKKNTEIQILNWNVTINKTVVKPEEQPSTTTTTTTTGAPYRIGAVKNDEKTKPFIDSDGLPMTVLIIMLVIVSILLFLAVFLLMHRYRSRCQRRDEDMYRPPAYCLAPDHGHHNIEWTDNSSSLKSKGSARTLTSRGHYSFAAHQNMPLPPIPHMTPRRNKTYRRPPSSNSSVRVQYIQPQDAIGQESSEDGEIAALSSGSPNVHYKTSRDRLSRQNSPLYSCVPVSSTDE